MIISEIALSYPCVKYTVKVSHFTARKSTAIEWVILEAINKCSFLQQYAGIQIESFFSHIFTITDADLLIRPCLISLHDMGAISISGIDDDTELSTVPMSTLSLTKAGQEMQKQGLLPGTMAEDTFSIYYDIISNSLLEENNSYKEFSNGLKVMDLENDEDVDFPMTIIKNWIIDKQKKKKKGSMNWLTPTTRIDDISPFNSQILWKNVLKKIDIGKNLVWKVVGNEDEKIDEISLIQTNFYCPENYEELPIAEITNPDEEIEKIVQLSEINELIKDFIMEDELFCVDEKYYINIQSKQLNKKKKIRIGIVFNSNKFLSEDGKGQIIFKIPNQELVKNCVYFNAQKSIQIGKFEVRAGRESKGIALAYVPKNTHIEITSLLLEIVEQYFDQDSSVLFILSEIGMKGMFGKYVERILNNLETLQEKVDMIENINSKSIKYYNQKMISAIDFEKLLVDDKYIINKCQTFLGVKEVLKEYSSINTLRQNEGLFQKILKLILQNIGFKENIRDIWEIWKEIEGIKKSYLLWINKNELYKKVYSNVSINKLFERFDDDSLFEINEYTYVEQILLNMKRIYISVKEILPEIDIKKTHSQEKISEIILKHRDKLKELYDEVRKWKDEEERITTRVLELDELLVCNSAFSNTHDLMNKILKALAIFFDDSFMKYNKVYIVDTCTLMKEPSLISWFDDNKALLVIPMVVLDELDGLKSDEDEEKSYNAREVIRNIENYKSYEWLNRGEQSYPELIPKDLNKERNDSKILSIAIRYSAKQPVLLTEDKNLSNIADAIKIANMKLSSYQKMKSHEQLNTKKNSKKNKKKKR